MWAPPNQRVPLERLVENTQRYLEEHPDDAKAHAQLGRAYSLAFVLGQEEFGLYGDWTESALPSLEDHGSWRPRERNGEVTVLDASRQALLMSSIRHYQRAVALDSKNFVYWLGLGYMYQLGARNAKTLVWPFPDLPFDEGAVSKVQRAWEEKAIEAYENVVHFDEKRQAGLRPAAAAEAAQGIVDILVERQDSSKEGAKRLAEARKKLAGMPRGPIAVTPIIFNLAQAKPLQALLSEDTLVTFDLAGDGVARVWPWVAKDTSILAWDPDGAGRITSGRQLFGSVTWWFFWENGYRALFALDDDGDGWLRGRELAGLAVWNDANQNGVSEPNEVSGIEHTGIAALAVREAGEMDGTPYHPAGLLMKDDRSLPTYDWVAEAN